MAAPSHRAAYPSGAPAAPAAEPLLAVRGLVKRYGRATALAGIDLEIPAGQWVALLGPNGAGKSTLFQILTGLFAADDGDARVAGHALRRNPVAALACLGVVFQQPALDLDLSARRNLRFHADLQGLTAASAVARIEALAADFGLAADLDRPTRELSGGNRRKVELARALLHAPPLLLMDEPTVGLDPKSRRDLREAVRQDVSQRGSAALWATHLIEEAEAADRVVVLHRGRILADGTPPQVTAALGGTTLEQGFIDATRARPPGAPPSPESNA